MTTLTIHSRHKYGDKAPVLDEMFWEWCVAVEHAENQTDNNEARYSWNYADYLYDCFERLKLDIDENIALTAEQGLDQDHASYRSQ
jgi:hypothetical protein